MAYTTIDKPSDYFNTVLYSGNGSTQSITGVGFQPDWVWIKRRDSSSSHRLQDKVRGAGEALFSNSTSAETTDSTSITSFDSDGFSLGNSGGYNNSGATFASWNWLVDNTTGSSNTDGDITSTVSANTTAGFSVGLYTGNATNSTIGHGLGKKPEFIITKRRNSTSSWRTQHGAIGATKTSELNDTDAFTATSAVYNNTEPTSSVFTVGTASSINASGGTYVFYAFTSIKGYSKMGSYTGNGSSNGPMVYTGFKPAWILLKRTDSADSWTIRDNKRDVDNVVTQLLYPDLSSAEATAASNNYLDIVSNGFKLRATSGQVNGSGGTYIYMAFAESPFVTSTGIPNNAR